MSVEEQYKYLRKIFNGQIRGPNTEAVLRALAAPSAYLVENIQAIHDSVYISTASDRYLDQRLADYNITRPPQVGLSDDVFRDIGISITNKKQIREILIQILGVIFGETLTQASANSNNVEPYNLDNGDDLLISFDGSSEVIKVIFDSSQFTNIHAATAQEVADAITKSIKAQGKNGRAYASDNGSGAFVTIISDTKGPQSSVTILGGKAQNQLFFDKARPTTAGPSTVWKVELVSGGNARFTWIGGANPSIGRVRVNDYVNIFASAFNTNNQGSFRIVDVKGGSLGNAYFEVYNPLAVSEIQTQGTSDGVLFYEPVKNLLISQPRYAALFQEEARLLEIFIPATTRVVRRERKGASHIHEPILNNETFISGSNQIEDITFPSPASINDGDYFLINGALTGNNYYVYFDTTGGNLVDPLAAPIGIRVVISGLTTATQVAQAVALTLNNSDFSCVIPNSPTIRLVQNKIGTVTPSSNGNISGLTISIIQTGVNEVYTVTSAPNPIETIPGQQGPYTYDLSQPFVLSHIATTSTSIIDMSTGNTLNVSNSSNFPDEPGFIIINYGFDNQEGPIPYLGRPSSSSILLSPAYQIKKKHNIGSEIRLIAQLGTVSVSRTGDDYPSYLTDVVSGRIYAEDLIKEVSSAGINLLITIIYPSDIGLGKAATITSEKVQIWGGDDLV